MVERVVVDFPVHHRQPERPVQPGGDHMQAVPGAIEIGVHFERARCVGWQPEHQRQRAQRQTWRTQHQRHWSASVDWRRSVSRPLDFARRKCPADRIEHELAVLEHEMPGDVAMRLVTCAQFAMRNSTSASALRSASRSAACRRTADSDCRAAPAAAARAWSAPPRPAAPPLPAATAG